MRAASSLVLIAGLASSAGAVDGVLEINHTCAVQTGCFSGDAAAYPVTIDGSAGRSYRLTGDLVVPDANTTGISVSAPSISIDLNGFEIVRSGCQGATADCTPASGAGSGVETSSSLNRGISVRNGSITGMGSYGVFLGVQAEVVGLRVRWNRIAGIFVNTASTVTGNTATSNDLDGISASAGSTVTGNTASSNGLRGIDAAAGSTISGNTTYLNSDGISAAVGSTVSRNATYLNGDDGIAAAAGSTISGNTAHDNTGDGIAANTGSIVQSNSVRSNGGFGLNLTGNAGYQENVITLNTAGTVSGGVNLGSNSCNSTATCP